MQANKDFNIQIFEAIKLEAHNYFNEIKDHFEPGTYNAKDLTKLIAGLSEKLQYKEVTRKYNGLCRYRKKDVFLVRAKDIDNRTHEATFLNSGKQISIEIDNFKVTFDACKVFDYLTKFARINGIREAIFFTNEVKTDKEPLISFDIDIQKDALDLCKYVASDELRPSMNHIYISLDYFTLVASDGHVLGEKRANISNLKGEGTPRKLFISSDALKKCEGPCKVSYYGDSTIIENNKGEQYINTIEGDFPNYKCVIPEVLNSPIIPVDYNQIKKFLTAAKKNKSIYRFLMEGKTGENKITLSVCEDLWEHSNSRTIDIELKKPIKMSFCIGYNIENFLKIGKFESMFLNSHTRASLFDLASGYSLLMPVNIENGYIESNCDYFIHSFASSAYLPSEPIMEEIKEENFVPVVVPEVATVETIATTQEGEKAPSYTIVVNRKKIAPRAKERIILYSPAYLHSCANINFCNGRNISKFENGASHGNNKELPLSTYIEQICVLLSLNRYIDTKTINICGEAKINNNFDCVVRSSEYWERGKFALYDARSG